MFQSYDPLAYIDRTEEPISGGQDMLGLALGMLDQPKQRRRSQFRGGGLLNRIERSSGDDIEVLFGPNVPDHATHLHLAAQKGIVPIGKKLEDLGFLVGEHPKFGGVNPVHTENSNHYSRDAIDVNYAGGGRWDTESQALRWLKRKLRSVYGDQAYYG